FEGVCAERPTMTEDNGLPRAPVIVVDLRSIFSCYRTHALSPVIERVANSRPPRREDQRSRDLSRPTAEARSRAVIRALGLPSELPASAVCTKALCDLCAHVRSSLCRNLKLSLLGFGYGTRSSASWTNVLEAEPYCSAF